MKKLITIIVIALLLINTTSNAQSAADYKKAAGIAAQIIGEYVGTEPTKKGEAPISVEYGIQHESNPASGGKANASMYLTHYTHKPHPHAGQFSFIKKLSEKWEFRFKYGEYTCERKVSGLGKSIVRVKAVFVIPPEKAKVKQLRVSVIVDFYAGNDNSGYFFFSLNRFFPISNESKNQLDTKGRNQAIADAEKIIEAIQAGLAGKPSIKVKKTETPPTENNMENKWLALSPAEILKTLEVKTGKKTSNPFFATLEKMGDYKQSKIINDLEDSRLLCLAAPDSIYSFGSFSTNSGNSLFVNQSGTDAVIMNQLQDGKIGVSQVMPIQEALTQACSLTTPDYPENWATFNKSLSPQEFMTLRGLAALSFTDTTEPAVPGFTLGEILFELGHPNHQAAISLFPERAKTALLSVTLNRNDLAVALLMLKSQHLVRKGYLHGNYQFSLTGQGKNLTDILTAGSKILSVAKISGLNSLRDAATGLKKLDYLPKVVLIAGKNRGLPLCFSSTGTIICGLIDNIGQKKLSASELLRRMIKDFL